MRRALFLLAVACVGLYEPGSANELIVRGAVTAYLWASAEAGPVGPPEAAYYTISVGGPEGPAAVVLTRAGSTPPPAGTYPVGATATGSGGFRGLVITGLPSHPSGVFQVRSGSLIVTAASPDRLVGRFELKAEGYLTRAPEQTGRMIAAQGEFVIHPREAGEAQSHRTGRDD